jgi:hypothetical protein
MLMYSVILPVCVLCNTLRGRPVTEWLECNSLAVDSGTIAVATGGTRSGHKMN